MKHTFNVRVRYYSLRLCVRDDENKNTNCAKIRGQTFFGDVMEADFERPDRTNPDWGNQYYRYKFGGSFNLYVGGSAVSS